MAAERHQHRISSVLTRIASGFSTFILAVILSTHFNPLGPNISPGDFFSENLLPIIIAKTEIPIGSRIIADQLQLVQMPRTVAPDGTFTKIDDTIIGRVVVTRIVPREPITESQLAPIGAVAGLVIREGYRAMTVRVDDVVGLSGFIMPGALVDVVIVIEPSDKSWKERVSKIVLQNVKVLANGANFDRPKNEKQVERVKTVTLQVTPEQAEKLAIASSEGKLQLVMRNSLK
jgi:pilus assembly protein CpaB